MADFKVIETQEEFDKAVGERLRREREKFEEKYADYDAVKEKADKYDAFEKDDFPGQLQKANDALKAANEKLASHDQTVSELTARAEAAELSLLKSRIAHESNIPYELSGRLNGKTEDEIKEDAKTFSSFISQKPVPPLHSTDPAEKANNDMVRQAEVRQLAASLIGNQ